MINRLLNPFSRLGQIFVRKVSFPYPWLDRMRFKMLYSLRAIHLYQPVPWLGFDAALRGKQTIDRWRAIRNELDCLGQLGTAMDLGAQLGYFSLCMAERGWLCLAVEGKRTTYNAAMLVQRATGIPNVAYRHMKINKNSVCSLPQVDVVIFLSLWHHLCRAEGFESAKNVLKEVLKRTKIVCFFETGQSTEDYESWSRDLPSMQPDPDTWITRLLVECGASHVHKLGSFDTYLGPIPRTLFAAYKDEATCKNFSGNARRR